MWAWDTANGSYSVVRVGANPSHSYCSRCKSGKRSWQARRCCTVTNFEVQGKECYVVPIGEAVGSWQDAIWTCVMAASWNGPLPGAHDTRLTSQQSKTPLSSMRP